MIETFVLFAVLCVGSAVDFKERRLPDWLTLPLLLLGLLLTFTRNREALFAHLLAALIGYLVLFLISITYRQLRKKDGLGLGDAKLLAAAGAWLGPLYLAPVVFLASILGLIFVLLLHLSNRRITMLTAIPFGPFLSAAFFVVWCAVEFGNIHY